MTPGAWLNGVHRTCAEMTAFHVAPANQTTTERYQYTTSVDINNTRYKKEKEKKDTVTHSESHANVRSESAREQRTALYKSYE